MTRHYPVVYEWAGKNFSGYAPDIPGCIATAKTLPIMRRSLKGALEAHLQWLQEDGEPIPPASLKVTVDMKEDREFPSPPGYYVVVERLDIDLPKKKRASHRKPAMRQLTAA
jgi:predicted RNase H-like HicB family nuclease